jgi:DNA-binding FadR family transcriptional regulator
MARTKLSVRIPVAIAADIGAKIVSGRLKVGKILDGEVAASGQRQVSRAAYREAMRILAAKGLVESRTKIGTRVSPVSKWHLLDPDVLSWMFAHEPPPHLLISLFELRKLVEPEAAALAAKRRSRKQLAQMAAALEEMTQETLQTNLGRQADRTFHDTLLAASGNPFLSTLSSSAAWSTIFKDQGRRSRRDPITDHIKVYDAIAAGNAKAARAAMIELIELAMKDTTESQLASRSKPAR